MVCRFENPSIFEVFLKTELFINLLKMQVEQIDEQCDRLTATTHVGRYAYEMYNRFFKAQVSIFVVR